MGHLVKQVELLDLDGVYLVEHVETGDVDSVAFQNIDEVVHCGVASEVDLCRAHTVLFHDLDNHFVGETGLVDGFGDGDAALFELLDDDIWRLFVQSDAESFKLVFYLELMGHWL